MGAIWALGAGAFAEGTPRLVFDRTTIDFGKTSRVESVVGMFKYTNTGDGLLKVEPPKPSCGCTVAGLKPDTLKPGESGELSFTLTLGRSRAVFEKHIAVRSNDPQTPEISLTIKADYTPLYDASPMALTATLPLGMAMTNLATTITRTDGQPIHFDRLEATKPWIKARVEATAGTNDSVARVRIEIERNGAPRRFSEYIHAYAVDRTNSPATTIYLYGQILGEVSLAPEAFYWSVTDPAKFGPEARVKRMTIRATTDKPLELKNPRSTLAGVKLELVPKQPGKVYELVATLDELPAATLSGNVSFETSAAQQEKVEVSAIVNVYKPATVR
jgi:hypothetical protein